MGLEYQWKTIFYPQTIIHPPILHGSPGRCWLTLQARLVCGLTRPAGWPWQGFGCKPFDLSCLRHHGPVELQAIPSRRERFVPWPPLLWSARKSQDWRAFFFPDLRTLKGGRINGYKARGREWNAQTSIALFPFFSTELFVAHRLSSPPPPPPFPPAGAAGSLPCLHSSLRSHLWSRAISNIFFLLLATSSRLISFENWCCIISA
jgi:hypothetical protein